MKNCPESVRRRFIRYISEGKHSYRRLLDRFVKELNNHNIKVDLPVETEADAKTVLELWVMDIVVPISEIWNNTTILDHYGKFYRTIQQDRLALPYYLRLSELQYGDLIDDCYASMYVAEYYYLHDRALFTEFAQRMIEEKRDNLITCVQSDCDIKIPNLAKYLDILVDLNSPCACVELAARYIRTGGECFALVVGLLEKSIQLGHYWSLRLLGDFYFYEEKGNNKILAKKYYLWFLDRINQPNSALIFRILICCPYFDFQVATKYYSYLGAVHRSDYQKIKERLFQQEIKGVQEIKDCFDDSLLSEVLTIVNLNNQLI